jgi:cell division protein FtsB
MMDEYKQPNLNAKPLSAGQRFAAFYDSAWRPAGTLVAVCLIGLLMWHVVNGQHGLTIWQQGRAEDRTLQKEIQDLQQQNEQLRQRVDKLKNDPNAAAHEAIDKLHYAKPGEVIVTFPAQPQTPQPSATPATK